MEQALRSHFSGEDNSPVAELVNRKLEEVGENDLSPSRDETVVSETLAAAVDQHSAKVQSHDEVLKFLPLLEKEPPWMLHAIGWCWLHGPLRGR